MNENDETRDPELEEILAAARRLPRSIEPRRDLWAGIESRLGERRAGGIGALPARSAGGSGHAGRWQGLLQAAAAVLLLLTGGVLSQILFPGDPLSPAGVAESPVVTAAERLARFEGAESDYLRAREELWRTLAHARGELSPGTLRALERNLSILDESIVEIRRALAEDSADPRLEELYLASHRRRIELVERLERAVEEG